MAETVRRVGPATLEFEKRRDGVFITATVSMNGDVWRGVGAFPLVAEDEAWIQFYRIQTPVDLEALVRAWSSQDTWFDYKEFMEAVGI